ncbi:MAG: hypothetical protein H3C58_11885, partial [Fimbriimonadaceae bacterium]|nr:hypothetical protein [Fimbriimonadaceae bacterium]
KKVVATGGTYRALCEAGIACEVVSKISQGSPNLLDLILSGGVSMMINTPGVDKEAEVEAARIRRACIETGVPCVTSIDTAMAIARAVDLYQDPAQSQCLRLQEYFHAPAKA